MTEQNESLIDTLTKVTTLDDLEASLPPTITERLGKGEDGVNRVLSLIKGLARFPSRPSDPEPPYFTRVGFDNVIAWNRKTNEPPPPEESQKMIDVALEAGFIKRVSTRYERYVVNPQIKPLAERLLKE